ncbi:MAG: C39 family peptidase [Pseudomonadales bacterium]|nr:C39 family peptidase [Pseudomonadales bacterium]
MAGPADWQCAGDGWLTAIELPELPAGQIVAPSFSLLSEADYDFQFCLCVEETRYPLARVPGRETLTNASDSQVQTAIDCYHSLMPLSRVRLEVHCRSQHPPQRYLFSVSARPALLEADMPGCGSPAGARAFRTGLPPAYSQMLENPRHAAGICSPVSAAMVLAHHGHLPVRERFIAACLDPLTRAYGVWPLAIHAASRQGSIGAVELFEGWAPVIACLERDLPVVASIRFSAGTLPGAPMAATAGHLVVVHGLEGDSVLVNDPAAPHHGAVNRRYPVTAFSEAWFRHRGAAYILLP